MASLNTLRTKFGAVLSVIIAFALLAFILSLKTDMGFSDNDPKVGVIDGDKIRYSEYMNQYDAVKSRNGGVEASTDEQSDQLAAATWQALFADHVLMPGFEQMGIEVPESERLEMVSGRIPSQAFYSAFGDPRTGAYNAAAVSQFLSQAAADARAQQAWIDLNDQAKLERAVQKYASLVGKRIGCIFNIAACVYFSLLCQQCCAHLKAGIGSIGKIQLFDCCVDQLFNHCFFHIIHLSFF